MKQKLTFIQRVHENSGFRNLGETLSEALDLIGDGIWVWDRENSLLYFSPGFYTMLGYEVDEFAPSLETWRELVHEDDRSFFDENLSQNTEDDGRIREFEYQMRTRHDTYRWVFTRSKVIERDEAGNPLRIVGSNADITERKRAIRALRDSEERYRNLYERSPLIYQALDKEGYIIDVNSAWLRAMGYAPREAIARWFGDFLVFHYREQFMEDYDSMRPKGQLKGLQYELQRRDKSRMFAEIDMKIAYDNQDNFLQAHCIIRDITEHKRIEESLRRMTESLRNEQKALTEKNIALRQVLKHIENDRKNYRHRLGVSLEETILPILDRLKGKVDKEIVADIEEIYDNFEAILEKDINLFKEKFGHLTPRETEMCTLIRDGLTSKEISTELNLSVVTIHKHRELIRRKLGLANKRVNLAGYLKSRMNPEMNIGFIDDEN